MKRMMIWIFLALFLSSPAQASEEHPYDKATRHHQKIVDACREKSQPKWDTGNIDLMYDGAYEYADCLHKAIIKISDVFFVETKNKNRKEEFLKFLKMHTEEAYHVYYLLYHGACDSCSTLNNALRIMPVAGEMENILLTMLQQAYDNNRPVADLDLP